MLDDFYPQVKHIAEEKNLLTDPLSQLEMKHKSHDIIDWEPPQDQLQYSNNNPNHKIVMWLNSLNYKPGCNDKRPYELTEETERVEESWPPSL